MKDKEADHESLDLCVASNEPEQLMLVLAKAAKAAQARATGSQTSTNIAKAWDIVETHALTASDELQALNDAPERPDAVASPP